MDYLVHKTVDGEPVGVWAEGGSSYYLPGNEAASARGKRVVGNKGTQVPWQEFIQQKVRATAYHDSWGTGEGSNLEDALTEARHRYFAARDRAQAVDR